MLAALVGYVAMRGIATLAGASPTVALLAALMAIMPSVMLGDRSLRERVETTGLLPFVAAAGVCVGTLLAPHRVASDVVFVAVMFAVAWARGQGTRWNTCGMVAFMGYFFSLFLRAQVEELGWLALAAFVGVGSMALLQFAIVPDRPAADLRRLLRSFVARTASVIENAADMVGADAEASGDSAGASRRVSGAVVGMNQVALLIEQQLNDPVAARGVTDVDALRDRTFDLELAAEHLASAAQRAGSLLSPRQRPALQEAFERVAADALAGRRSAVDIRFPPDSGDPGIETAAAGHLVASLDELAGQITLLYADAVPPVQAGPFTEPILAMRMPKTTQRPDRSDGGDPPVSGDDEAGMSAALRQAIQVTIAGALAIVAGEFISPARWYWAVLAAFVVFSNAPSGAATVRRAVNRVLGTALGVVAGAVVGFALAGDDTIELILLFVFVFAAYWAYLTSYGLMIFFLTIDLALLYSLIGKFSEGVLVVRLEETAVGAALGAIVAVVMLPARALRVADEAVATLFGRIADLVATIGSDPSSGRDLRLIAVRSRDVDNAFQRARDAARPAHAGIPGGPPRARRDQTLLLAGCRYWARLLAVSYVRERGDGERDELPAEALDRVRHNLNALQQRLSGTEAPDGGKLWPLPESEPLEAFRVSHARLALRHLDETVLDYAEARGLVDSSRRDERVSR